MRNKMYGALPAVKVNATINPINKAKLELLARQNGVTLSVMLNLLIDMAEPPIGWAELEKHLIRHNTQLAQTMKAGCNHG